MIITISGRPGSGKSVVASAVADALGLRHVSAGDFMRQIADERGVSILELSRSAEEHAAIDKEIDARTVDLARDGGDFVMDARLGWHFIPNSFKVFLDVSPDVAARRIFEAARGSEHENVDLASTRSAMERRTESERNRYLEYYGLDYTDHSRYDLILDTSNMTVEDVAGRIVEQVREMRSG